MSLDLKLRRSEGLKKVYGLKFFYLAENDKPFFTQWYANGKDVIVCGHEIIIAALLASENKAIKETRIGYSVLPYTSSGLKNIVSTIYFSPLTVKISRMKVIRIFSFENEFLLEEKETPFVIDHLF